MSARATLARKIYEALRDKTNGFTTEGEVTIPGDEVRQAGATDQIGWALLIKDVVAVTEEAGYNPTAFALMFGQIESNEDLYGFRLTKRKDAVLEVELKGDPTLN